MRRLIQELKVGGFSGPTGPLPGYLAEVWVPTRQGTAWKRLGKREGWWMYGERAGSHEGTRGLVYYVRIESPRLARIIEAEAEKIGGAFLGRLDRSKEKKAAQWSKRKAA